ncbi:hypothetical protein GW17_00004362 [Ensete ventricosum]|nr:hypothetical protein GW17_00004362 [Ensete ventricosum]
MLPLASLSNGVPCSFRNGVTHFSIQLRKDPLHLIWQEESSNLSINRPPKAFSDDGPIIHPAKEAILGEDPDSYPSSVLECCAREAWA